MVPESIKELRRAENRYQHAKENFERAKRELKQREEDLERARREAGR